MELLFIVTSMVLFYFFDQNTVDSVPVFQLLLNSACALMACSVSHSAFAPESSLSEQESGRRHSWDIRPFFTKLVFRA